MACIVSGLLDWIWSLAFVYIRNDSMTSGARYHLVATSETVRSQRMARESDPHSVMKPCSLFGDAVCVLLAKPKSHTLRSQLAFSSRLDGFRSRWMTGVSSTNLYDVDSLSALCKALIARHV